MSPERNSPGMVTEAVESSGENVYPILPEFQPCSPEFNPFTFKLLPALPGNDSDPLYESRLLGFSEAWDTRQGEVDRLNDEADRLWMRANNSPTQIKTIQQDEIQQNAETYWLRFMEGEAA